MVEGKFHVVNNISRIGENFFHLMVTNITSSLLHAICVYLELGNALAIEAMQLVIIKTQVALWKPHNCESTYWGSFHC
jgi:hypothetical protein